VSANTKPEQLNHQLSCWDPAMPLYLDKFYRPTATTLFLTKSGPPFLKEEAFGQHPHAAHLVLAAKPAAFQVPQGMLNNSRTTPSTKHHYVLHLAKGLSITT